MPRGAGTEVTLAADDAALVASTDCDAQKPPTLHAAAGRTLASAFCYKSTSRSGNILQADVLQAAFRLSGAGEVPQHRLRTSSTRMRRLVGLCTIGCCA